METVDTAVIGAGVVGLAAARAIARRGHSVCVLEREPRPGTGTSTHNSQVIHAGIYYPAGSLKARHCVAGARMLYEFCDAHGVPFTRCGKLIVAHDEDEIASARERFARAARRTASRVSRIVDAGFIRAREPHVRAHAALFSPTPGILEAEALVRTLARLCVDADVALLTGTPLTGADVAGRRDRAADTGGTHPGALGRERRGPVRGRGVGGGRRRAVPDLSVPRRIRGAGACQAPAGERARLSAAAHPWTRRPSEQDHSRQRHARSDGLLIRIARTTTRGIESRSRTSSSRRACCCRN